VFGSWRVAVVTPAGRRRYLEILVPYVMRERAWLDEYQLWVNTADEHDLGFLSALERRHRGFVRLVHGSHAPDGSRTVRHFYPAAADPRTIYLKLDDDICFIAQGALRKLIRFRARHPGFLLVHANAVNTVLASYIHQRLGASDARAGTVRNDPFCPVGWKSGRFAAAAHRQFLGAVRDQAIGRYRFGLWPLPLGARCSLNCCAWLGSDFAAFDGVIDGEDDEQWLSVQKPRQLGRTSCMLGTALVAHFAYFPQRYYLERWTTLLEEYRELSGDQVSARGRAATIAAVTGRPSW
jgi:hypothetical protein